MKINILPPINVQQQKVRSNGSTRGVFIAQNTSTSVPSPVRHPGQPSHVNSSQMMERFGQIEYPLQQANLLKQICYICITHNSQ